MSAVAAAGAVVALVASALCAAADGALLSVADNPGAAGTGDGPTGGLRDATHRSLAVARLIGILATGVTAASALDLREQAPGLAALLAIAIALVILLLGELAPRAAGEAMGAPALRTLAWVVRAAEVLMRPLVDSGARLDAALRRMLPPSRPGDAAREVTAEQLRRIVNTPPAAPAAPRAPHAILHRVFSLSDTEVHEVMVPRVDILGIALGTPWSEVLDRVRSSQHARLPVYDDTIDHVTGILFAKDLLPAVIADEEPAAGWPTLVRPAAFIPESKTIDAQLRDFKANGTHIAIVVDEFGGTAGLVTIENILEEIVGEIRDEYDREEPPIESEAGQRWWISGRVTLDELSEALGIQLDREDVSTVGGLIFELVGHVPRAGEELTLHGFRVVVERVVRRRVDRVYFERLETPAEHVS